MTRVAIISDIHGNCFAFDAVLTDLQTRSITRWCAWGMRYREGRSLRKLWAGFGRLDVL